MLVCGLNGDPVQIPSEGERARQTLEGQSPAGQTSACPDLRQDTAGQRRDKQQRGNGSEQALGLCRSLCTHQGCSCASVTHVPTCGWQPWPDTHPPGGCPGPPVALCRVPPSPLMLGHLEEEDPKEANPPPKTEAGTGAVSLWDQGLLSTQGTHYRQGKFFLN